MKKIISYKLEKRTIFVILAIIFVIIHLFLTLYIMRASTDTGEESSALSEKVTEEVIEVIETVDKNFTYDFDTVHHFVRKAIGHFGLFMLNAISLMLALIFVGFALKYAFLTNIGMGLVYAILSELIQLTRDGRACEIKDIFIDYFGCITGVLIVSLIVVLIYHRKFKREKCEQK